MNQTLSETIFDCLSAVLELSVHDIKNIPIYSELGNYGFDSLSFIKFIVSIEEALNIEINDEDLLTERFNTMNKIYQRLESYCEKKDEIKCIVVDCDNVLWSGIVADDEPISVFFEFQSVLIEAYQKGILICLCSKNDEEAVMHVLQTNLDMKINIEHIVAYRINWKEKYVNIVSLVDELNISLESILFIDDSEREILLVNQKLPSVSTLHFCAEHVDEIITYIKNLSFICSPSITKESAERTAMYKQEKQRESAKGAFYEIEDYHRSLKTVLTFSLAEKDMLPRLHELSMRTNQFNLTNKRYKLNDLEEFCHSEHYDIITLRAADIFGDMQTVAFAAIHYQNKKATIEGFMMSCRVFGRFFEDAILHQIINEAKRKRITKLIGLYEETDKNKRFSSFYPAHGFIKSNNNYILNLDESDNLNLVDYFNEIRWIL